MSESQYWDLVNKVIDEGVKDEGRNGGTRSLFSAVQEWDISTTIPLLTRRKIALGPIVSELKWFLSGSTNVRDLQAMGNKIWDGNSSKEYMASRGLDYDDGNLGPMYGGQWRHSGAQYDERGNRLTEGVDQIGYIIDQLTTNPNGRRHVLSSWAPIDLPKMALPPCHMSVQFYSRDGYLDCKMYQRSADLILGVPFNIAQYSILTHLIGSITGLKPRRFIHDIGDAHVYECHVDTYKNSGLSDLEDRPFPTIHVNDITRDDLWNLPYEKLGLERNDGHTTYSFGSFLRVENCQPRGVVRFPMVP